MDDKEATAMREELDAEVLASELSRARRKKIELHEEIARLALDLFCRGYQPDDGENTTRAERAYDAAEAFVLESLRRHRRLDKQLEEMK